MIRWVQRLMLAFLIKYLPNKGKRMIYILMCYIVWSKHQSLDELKERINEVNQQFRLTNNRDALNFVIEIKDILMDLDDFRFLREIEQQDSDPSEVSKKIPEYLKYAEDKVIKSEMTQLFSLSHSFA